MVKIIWVLVFLLVSVNLVLSQANSDSTKKERWTNHFQLTVISQSHAAFRSNYKGNNSLGDSVELGATSLTATLFIGRRLWKGGAIYFNPEVSGGSGLSLALGVAGALNGETYRIGNPAPAVFIARTYLQQNFALGNTAYEYMEDDINQVKDSVPAKRITISVGKFAMGDFFDDNKYNHDPRTQFLNWSLMSNGAWDYPANTRGYTLGVVTELIYPKWAVRFSTSAVPRIANAPKLEYNVAHARSETAEFEKKFFLNKRPGKMRLLLNNTISRAPSYEQGLKALATGDQFILNVISGRAENTSYGGSKFGLGAGMEQEITARLSLFSRAGWNDGHYATWAFTEIDRTFQVGLSVKGAKWERKPEDVFGIAGVINGISDQHRAFLKAGGYGFIIGDGNLTYSNEMIMETWYNAHLSKLFWFSLDYQFVANPGYNRDRGPVSVLAARGHIEL